MISLGAAFWLTMTVDIFGLWMLDRVLLCRKVNYLRDRCERYEAIMAAYEATLAERRGDEPAQAQLF